ncbi:linoleate diol synthase [Hysterangium stoloniferum]|nr:linoleate diol synthase [Hysterangium stoloniferum]
MSLLANLPGAKNIVKAAGNSLDKIEKKADALHNAFLHVNVRDADVDYDAPQSKAAQIVDAFRDQVKRGNPISLSPQVIPALIDALKNSKAIDDRKMLLEHALVFLSRLPDSALATKLTADVIELLYYDLPHPPATYMGAQYRWRTADGGYNNVNVPDLGRAGTPYSRSVQAQNPLVLSELPDPELVYQALLKRDEYKEHPAGLSSLMFGFAALVIHSIFRTDFQNWSINQTSSYVDLAPLYGNDQATQDSVRTSPKDGRGTLKPDTFAEDRLLLLPPATAAILVLFNRNHNVCYIAQKLLEINESDTWVSPDELVGNDKAKDRATQDEEIFQTTRLINAAWFAQVVFSDYFSSILGLVRDGSSWTLAPFGEIRRPDHTMVERGQGNSVSIEFNLLYRWHPTMSEWDEKWTEGVFEKIFQGKPYDQITIQDFGSAMRAVKQQESPEPSDWEFGDIKRDPNDEKRFKDEDLARILKDSNSRPASAFKARGSPPVMRIIEIMGINQARTWGACSLNDFRRFLQLKPYESFEEWNPDKEIANTARKLYGDIERLELYPGLQAEETKPVEPGAGLCPPYTTSRAILAGLKKLYPVIIEHTSSKLVIDAIALTRGDRFFTADFTPANLTAWGFQDCQRDTTNAGFGSMLGRLLLRTLPHDYTENSTFTWFPLMTPEAMEKNLTKLGIADKYSFDRPGRAPGPHIVESYAAVNSIVRDRATFHTPYVPRVQQIFENHASGYLASLNDPEQHKADSELLINSLGNDASAMEKAEQFYFDTTQALIKQKSFTLSGSAGYSVDLVGEVLNLVPVHFAATAIAGLPLKTETTPRGIYTEHELQQMLRDVFSYVFFEVEAAKKMRAEHFAGLHTQELLGYIKTNVKNIGQTGFFHSLAEFFSSGSTAEPSLDFMQKLVASKKSRDEVVNNVFAVVLLSSVEYAQALVNVVAFYLDGEGATHRKNIETLATVTGPAADAQLRGYVREALRLDPSLRGTMRHSQADFNAHGVQIPKDQPVFLSFVKANADTSAFSNPDDVDPTRKHDGILSLLDVVEGALGGKFVESTMAQVLKVVFGLKNLRPGPGVTGKLKRLTTTLYGTTYYQYLDAKRELAPWAKSMIVQYDA